MQAPGQFSRRTGRHGHFVLVNDITVTGRVNHFAGVFDGRGHTIHVNRTLGNGETAGGIFGFNDPRAVIANVHVAGYIIGERANAASIGGLIDTNHGTIFNVTSSVTVVRPTVSEVTRTADGGLRVGGLVGNNYGTVINSRASGDITGSRYVGGLVGVNRGHIINSLATGNVKGDEDVGALVGLNVTGRDNRSPAEARIHQSDATGNVEWAGGRADRRSGAAMGIGGMVGRNADGAIVCDEPPLWFLLGPEVTQDPVIRERAALTDAQIEFNERIAAYRALIRYANEAGWDSADFSGAFEGRELTYFEHDELASFTMSVRRSREWQTYLASNPPPANSQQNLSTTSREQNVCLLGTDFEHLTCNCENCVRRGIAFANAAGMTAGTHNTTNNSSGGNLHNQLGEFGSGVTNNAWGLDPWFESMEAFGTSFAVWLTDRVIVSAVPRIGSGGEMLFPLVENRR